MQRQSESSGNTRSSRSASVDEQAFVESLSPDQKALLLRCEAILRDAQSSFIAVGKALEIIERHELYKIRHHKSLIRYCRSVWGMPKSTVFMKMSVNRLYTKLHEEATASGLSITNLPTKESHLRQLLTLKSPTLQIEAWQHAIQTQQALNGAMTAKILKTAVAAVKSQHTFDIAPYLTADDSFPMIPHFLYLYRDVTGENAVVYRPNPIACIELLDNMARQEIAEIPKSVLVSPVNDIAEFDDTRYLRSLIQMLTRLTAYRFIVWTRKYQHIDHLTAGSPNIDVVIRSDSQQHLDAFMAYRRANPRQQSIGLWIHPLSPITVSALELSMLLLGGPCQQKRRLFPDISAIRTLFGSFITTSMPIYLSRDISAALGEAK